MSARVAEMTPIELRQMIGNVIEEKLFEFLGDPDRGLEMTKSMQNRLKRQMKSVATGERGISLNEAKKRLKAK
jgi:hypothetical protein